MPENRKGQLLDVRQKILAANQAAAEQLRADWGESGTLTLNLIASPGAGKTTLLEASLARLRPLGYQAAVLVGDIATERDAERIRALGIRAHQILTGGSCHLDARLVQQALAKVAWLHPDILFIENVGNLICPTSYDLGEDFKVALLSVTEGDDKPFKYPAIFARAAVTLITKCDLLPHVDFDVETVLQRISTLNSSGRVLTCSARTGEGLQDWTQFLEQRLASKRKGSNSVEQGA